MLQVRLLGQFDVRADGSRIVIPSRAGQSLFAYLILTAGKMHRREKLAGLFWPDSSDDLARRYLRNELWRVRKAIQQQSNNGDDSLLADEYTLGFNPTADYWLDAAALTASTNDLDALTANLALYQGELLPGFYDDWVLLEREQLHARFENKMQSLLTQLIQAARWSSVIEWCEKWIALGQTPEAAYRGLLVAYAATGNRQQVVATYKRCLQDMEREVSVAPSDETRALYEQIMRGNSIARVDLYAQAIPPIRLVHDQEPAAPGESPFKGLEYFDEKDADLFFGREELVEKLVADLDAPKFLAVIVGASGSGKSSLVRAGLVPALKAKTNDRVKIFVLTPTARPLEALALALTREHPSVTTAPTLMDDFARDARALHFFLQRETSKRASFVRGDSPHAPRR
jgi:DNA-binding SARP family transcriptional activator